jgi:transposase InsO family protein
VVFHIGIIGLSPCLTRYAQHAREGFLKAADLITAPDYVVIKAANEFTDKTTAVTEMWQTDFTYFKIIGWGWYYLSTILDDYSRYIISWKLCANMRAEDVTDTIDLALAASGCNTAVVRHMTRLLSDNGSNGQVERMNRTIKDATEKRYHYDNHDQLRTHLADFMAAYDFARRLKSLNGLTPYEYICKIWTSEPDIFIVDPNHQMPGLNT